MNALRRLYVGALVLAILYVVYVGALYLALRGPIRARLSDPTREVRISFQSAWTLVPGMLRVRGLVVAGDYGNAGRWQVQVERADFVINLFKLVTHDVVLSLADGEGVQIAVRTDRANVDAAAVAPPVATPRASLTPSEPDDWTVRIKALSLRDIGDLWIDQYPVRGGAKIDGELYVDEAGDLSARVALDAATDSVGFLNLWLADTPSLSIGGGGGRLTAQLGYGDGRLTPGSMLNVASDTIDVNLLGQTASGHGDATLSVEGETDATPGRVHVAVALGAFTLGRTGAKAPGVAGEGFRVEASSSQLVPVPGTDKTIVPRDWRVEATLPEAAIKDAAYLGSFLPRGTGFRILRGRGTVAGHLVASAQAQDENRGALRVRAQEIGLAYDENKVHGAFTVDAEIRSVDLATRRLEVSGSKVTFTDVVVDTPTPGRPPLPPWWGRIALPRGFVTLNDETRVEGDVVLEAQSLKPLLAAFTAKDPLPEWALNALAFEGLTAKARIAADERRFDVDGAHAEAKGVALDGWLRQLEERRTAALLVRYGILTVGVGLAGGETSFHVIGAKTWFGKQKPP